MAVNESRPTESPGVVDLRDDLSTPGDVLEAVTRARASTHEVMVHTLNRGDAQAVFRLLKHPVRAVTDTGVRLYSTATPVTLPDGRVPVVPSGVGDISWELGFDGDLSLFVGETRVANGPVTIDVGALEYASPRSEETDGMHRVETANGILVTIGSNRDAVLHGYRRIPVPHVPRRLHYLTDTTVQYRGDDEQRVYAPRPSWLDNDPMLPDAWRVAVPQFVETYTRYATGESLPVSWVSSTIQQWVAAHLPRETPELGVGEQACIAVLAARFDTRTVTVDGRDTMVLTDRATSIPEQALTQESLGDGIETKVRGTQA